MNHKFRIVGLVFLLDSIAMLPLAKADEVNHKTTVTLSAPIAAPGTFVPAKQYVSKLAESQVNRDIAQIVNENQTHSEATSLAVPAYRWELEERPNRSVGKWFFAGQLDGVEFVYHR
jgi:hypothetical protein